MTRIDMAFLFAADLHRSQKRKVTGTPYLSHLLAVAALVMEDGGSEEEVAAGFLHDALEDQGASYPGGQDALRNCLRERFSERVLEIVDACTVDGGCNLPRTEVPWRLRKERYIAHLQETQDAGILRVACADKLHNARSLLAEYGIVGEELWQRFRAKERDSVLWYYGELARVFQAKSVGRLGDELSWCVSQLEYVSAPRKTLTSSL